MLIELRSMTEYSDIRFQSDITLFHDIYTERDLVTKVYLITVFQRFPYNICDMFGVDKLHLLLSIRV